jgi:high-affinity Fe2+/Pb2+ permease
MNIHRPMSNLALICAFLIGVVLFISFGRHWLHLESMLVFLAGLLGVALAVLVFGILNLLRNSHKKEG